MTTTRARPWLEQYDAAVPRELALEEVSVPALVERAIHAHPERTALVFQGTHIAYHRLGAEIERFATALARLDVAPGTAVAIHLPNLPQTVVAYQAALRIGARVVLTNPMYTAHEIEHQWSDAGCEVLGAIVDGLCARQWGPAEARCRKAIAINPRSFLG